MSEPPQAQQLPPGLWDALRQPSSTTKPPSRLLTSFPNGLPDVTSHDQTNKYDLICPRDGCTSLILKSGVGKYVEGSSAQMEVSQCPPHPLLPSLPEQTHWWLITPSPMKFENIGFSRPVQPSQSLSEAPPTRKTSTSRCVTVTGGDQCNVSAEVPLSGGILFALSNAAPGFNQDICETFTKNQVDGDVLIELNDEILECKLGIVAYGPRHKIMNAICYLRQEVTAKGHKRGPDNSFTDGGKGKQLHMDPTLTVENVSTYHPKPLSPDRLTTNTGITDSMLTAFEPFEEYIQHLAEGKFDAFLDSHCRADKTILLKYPMSTDPNLLLHQIGKDVDMNKMDELFIEDTVHLFNTSGSGKTRLILDGLCHKWGFYFSCRLEDIFKSSKTGGSRDFKTAISMMQTLSGWDQGAGASRLKRNAITADRVFAMLFCARAFILEKFISFIPPHADAISVRRRWVFLQVMPPRVHLDEILVTILRSIRAGDTQVMLEYVRATMANLRKNTHLFPTNAFFLVFDEAQDAANCLPYSFPATTDPLGTRSALHEFYRFAVDADLFDGFIISGTELSMEIVQGAAKSVAAKEMKGSYGPRVFVDTGNFLDVSSQEKYVRQHITLSDSPSDRRLLQRIAHWFVGRYRLTASLIELFLFADNAPRHRILTAFVKQITRFTITDATDLEEKEDPIPHALSEKMRRFGRLLSREQLFQHSKHDRLITLLTKAVKMWVIGSQPRVVPIEDNMHEMVELGVGLLTGVSPDGTFNPKINYPVYIAEPLVVVSLSTLLEEIPPTRRRCILAGDAFDATNTSYRGYVLEDLVLLVLMKEFGGKSTRLGDVFHLKHSVSDLASRKVSLVALLRTDDGEMLGCQSSFDSGGSDRYAFKAQSPTHVFNFFHHPKGRSFLLPDIHMGPDVVAFFRDEETGELIIILVQVKATPTLHLGTWLSAIDSTLPDFFYTMISEEQRKKYVTAKYPDIADDINDLLKSMLGEGVFEPVIDAHRQRLCSSTRTKEDSDSSSQPKRHTPRYLRVIATPDDQQRRRLEAEAHGDVAVLKWERVEQYVGSAAVTDKSTSV